MPDVTFRLLTILKPEMRAKLERAQRHAQPSCPFPDSVDPGPPRKAEIGDRDLYRLQNGRDFGSREPLMGEQLQASLVELDSVPLKLYQKLQPAHATDTNGSDHMWVVPIG